MKLEARSVASSSTAWLASAAQWQWQWPTWCRSSICPWTTPTISSRWKSPTSHPTSTSWASSWTLSARWAWRARATTAWQHRASSSTLQPRPTTMSSSWTPWSPREVGCHHPLLAEKAAKKFLFFPSSAVRLGSWRYWYSWFEATAAERGYWRANAVWPRCSCCGLNEERQ